MVALKVKEQWHGIYFLQTKSFGVSGTTYDADAAKAYIQLLHFLSIK